MSSYTDTKNMYILYKNIPYDVELTIYISTEYDYGADIDGNRGYTVDIVDDIKVSNITNLDTGLPEKIEDVEFYNNLCELIQEDIS